MRYDGKRLCDEIARREMSVVEFARMTGISQSVLYRAIAGGDKVRTKTLGKIAAALNFDKPSELLMTEQDTPKGILPMKGRKEYK